MRIIFSIIYIFIWAVKRLIEKGEERDMMKERMFLGEAV
jgi:hypothetical protein